MNAGSIRTMNFRQHAFIACIHLPGLHHLRSCLFVILYAANPIGPLSLPALPFPAQLLICRSWQSDCSMYHLVSGTLSHGRVHLGPIMLLYGSPQLYLFFFVPFLGRKKPYMSAKVADRSNSSGQLKETSGSKAYAARPTTGEAALPWQAIRV